MLIIQDSDFHLITISSCIFSGTGLPVGAPGALMYPDYVYELRNMCMDHELCLCVLVRVLVPAGA